MIIMKLFLILLSTRKEVLKLLFDNNNNQINYKNNKYQKKPDSIISISTKFSRTKWCFFILFIVFSNF